MAQAQFTETIDQSPEIEKPKKGSKELLKKFGKYGFLFFLIKGLLWIAVAVAAYFGFTN